MDRSTDRLTWDDIERAMEEFAPPTWLRMIRDADEVEVKASSYLPDDGGDVYVLDPNQAQLIKYEAMPTLAVMVVCRPEHREQIEKVVDEIRAPAWGTGFSP